jgi:hypothetical protein
MTVATLFYDSIRALLLTDFRRRAFVTRFSFASPTLPYPRGGHSKV